jgi:hypothetical protein
MIIFIIKINIIVDRFVDHSMDGLHTCAFLIMLNYYVKWLTITILWSTAQVELLIQSIISVGHQQVTNTYLRERI